VEHLIEVAFKGNRREFFRWAFEAPPPARAAIVVETERGEDLGHVHATGELAEKRKAGTTHGKEQREPLRAALRLASSDDIAKAAANRVDEEIARRAAVKKARELNLQMKVSDAEWQWDRRRLTFYFSAEERVDFRSLVRQLESQFAVRVQMWHIGPRDEAKRLDGVGHCGRQLCSASWLPELLPVKTSLAKDQRLSTITPTQISGACGRLMCCLRYEHDFYVQARKRFPKHGKIVQTLQGEEKVDNADIFRDTVTLRNPAGETRVISLVQFKKELAGEAMPVDDEPHEESDDESTDERMSTAPSAPARGRPSARDSRAPLSQLQRAPARESRPPRDGQRDTRRGAPPAAHAATPAAAHPTPQAPHAPAAPPAPPAPPAPRPPRVEPAAPAPEAAAPATAQSDDATQAAESDQRRGRRRRGRRGGRRHRGDGSNHGSNGGGDTPPHNPNT
jgi:cell fate regulator YaaT (PSP1 superfamily)